MNRNQINAIIGQIECEFDINSIYVKGVRCWPLLRSLIIKALKSGLSGIPSEVPYVEAKTLDYINQYVSEYRALSEKSTLQPLNNQSNKSKSLFLTSEVYRGNLTVADASFHKFFDCTRMIFPKEHELVGLEFPIMIENIPTKKYFPTSTIHHLIELARIQCSLNILACSQLGQEDPIPSALAAFYSYLRLNGIPITINATNFVRKMLFIFELANHFKRLIELTEAEAFFLICYYTDNCMAAILAARQMGIPSIELQHGQQGDDHPCYSNWNKLPSSGYELLPTAIATWGEPSQKRIEKMFAPCRAHGAFKLGNPFLTVTKHNLIHFDKPDLPEELLAPGGPIKVLVSLQPANVQWFLSELSILIRQLGNGFFWFIRSHPSHPSMKEYASHISSMVEQLSETTYVESQITTKAPLTEILKQVDVNLTQFSTVAYEALSYDVPSVLMLPNLNEHLDMCDSNFFRFDNAQDAANHMQGGKLRQKLIGNSYIEEATAETIADLLNYSRNLLKNIPNT